MSVTPFFRTPFTDLTGCLVNHQQYDKCGEFEMKMIDCMEAYGVDKGIHKCRDIIADFQECSQMKKQLLRFNAMRMERHRQWITGQRLGTGHYAEAPRVDGY